MRQKKFEKYDILLIEWKDIIQDARWHTKEESKKIEAVDIKTLGFFLDNSKKQLRIAHSVASDGDSDITVIPWGTIQSIKKLEV